MAQEWNECQQLGQNRFVLCVIDYITHSTFFLPTLFLATTHAKHVSPKPVELDRRPFSHSLAATLQRRAGFV